MSNTTPSLDKKDSGIFSEPRLGEFKGEQLKQFKEHLAKELTEKGEDWFLQNYENDTYVMRFFKLGLGVDYLKHPELFNNINQELGKKIVGQNKPRCALFLYSCGSLVINSNASSYNLVVNDESGYGKDHITKAVTQIWPYEKTENTQAVSPTALMMMVKGTPQRYQKLR